MNIEKNYKTYRHACLGGTFDNLHAGHIKLLSEAFRKAEFVSIGVSTQSLKANKAHTDFIQDFDTRKAAVLQFLKENNWIARASVFPIHDIYGPTITDQSINLLIVTAETEPNARKINRIRKKYELPLCEVHTIPYVTDSHHKIISSTRIRSGEIDAQGNNVIDLFTTQKKYTLPSSLRKSLRDPLGTIIARQDNEIKKTGKKAASFIGALSPSLVISVGDIATESLQDAGLTPHISVIDFKTRRAHLIEPHEIPKNDYVLNPAGTLCQPAVKKLYKIVKKYLKDRISTQLIVKGEEDLLTLPAILLAPIGAVIVYGQYEVGLVVVKVDLDIKKKVMEIVRKFE